MLDNHLETIKQVAQHLETIIEKIDGLDFCPITWDDSFFLLRELETAVAVIDKLSEQLDDILLDDTFCDDVQNKAFVENIGEANLSDNEMTISTEKLTALTGEFNLFQQYFMA